MNETADATAVAHLEFMQDMLEYYGKTPLEDLDFLSGDNCSTNTAISDRMPANTPLVGCAAHRFNLAMKAWFSEEPLKTLIEKVEALSGKLSTTKMSTRLRNTVGKVAKKRQETRWQGTTNMIKRYIELRPHLLGMEDLSDEIASLIPSVAEHRVFLDLTDKIRECDKAWSVLQDRKRQDLLTVRTIFDTLIRTVRPQFAAYIGPDAPIVHNPHFENAVVKILDSKEERLTMAEKAAMTKFRIIPEEPRAAASLDSSPPSGVMQVLEGLDMNKNYNQIALTVY